MITLLSRDNCERVVSVVTESCVFDV